MPGPAFRPRRNFTAGSNPSFIDFACSDFANFLVDHLRAPLMLHVHTLAYNARQGTETNGIAGSSKVFAKSEGDQP